MAESPPSSPVKLSDCIENLLSFTLSSSINQTLTPNLPLSNDYCSSLLQIDPNLSQLNDLGGVPIYPLYKQLALALDRCVNSGCFVETTKVVMPFEGEDTREKRKDEWNKLIQEKGNELMLKAVKLQIHVQEPYFSQLRDGLKTTEGRCAVGEYNRIQPGDLLLFNSCLLLEVQSIECYPSFYDMLEAKGLERVLPGVKTIEEGVQIYRNFYTKEKENINGVIAINVTKPDSQPILTMASIISGLSYDGIGSLLGLMHTPGTVEEALPPARSSLLSSFSTPHKPTATGSSLTEGARALAKHVNRASEGWWGSFRGNDSEKNKIALGVITHLITHCDWMNIHYIQLDRCIFEIRVSEGYGARWSKDGSKFIGFVEPHMEDGHSKKWKH